VIALEALGYQGFGNNPQQQHGPINVILDLDYF